MLPEFLSLLVYIATILPELVCLIAVVFLEFRGMVEEVCRERLIPLFTVISGYLSTNIASGRARNLNPAIVSAVVTLTVIVQPELSKLIEGSWLSQLGGHEVINEYPAFWLNLLVSPPN